MPREPDPLGGAGVRAHLDCAIARLERARVCLVAGALTRSGDDAAVDYYQQAIAAAEVGIEEASHARIALGRVLAETLQALKDSREGKRR